ncbi:hypothetical protein [Microbispora sitophila]|uniref:hypothetical protein n=1 Tax=Microbispora sitophila TaxID=2771537 RepID=UPI0021F7147D|nr:hypothetical protein [Microbispora sitophila]
MDAIPYRASAASFTAGAGSTSTCPVPGSAISATRRSSSSSTRLDALRGEVRSRSSSETRRPSGTCSTPASSRASSGPVRSASIRYSRTFSCRRTSPTSRVSTVIPGNSTRSLSMWTRARSNNARGPSVVDHTRAATNRRISSSASAKSR